MVTSKKTTDFLRDHLTFENDALINLRKLAVENNKPLIQPETANLIYTIVNMNKPNTILEIGTSIGYSSTLMAIAAGKTTHIDTIEMLEENMIFAKENYKTAGVFKQINIFLGDALEILPSIETKYDMIFMDGPKSHYITLKDKMISLLNDNGVLICDNVLFRGYITGDKKFSRRKETIIAKLTEFLDELCQDKRLYTTILPIGDGVSISIIKGDNNE